MFACPCVPQRVPEWVWESLRGWGQDPIARPSPGRYLSLQQTLHESLMSLSVCLGTCSHIRAPACISVSVCVSCLRVHSSKHTPGPECISVHVCVDQHCPPGDLHTCVCLLACAQSTHGRTSQTFSQSGWRENNFLSYNYLTLPLRHKGSHETRCTRQRQSVAGFAAIGCFPASGAESGCAASTCAHLCVLTSGLAEFSVAPPAPAHLKAPLGRAGARHLCAYTCAHRRQRAVCMWTDWCAKTRA